MRRRGRTWLAGAVQSRTFGADDVVVGAPVAAGAREEEETAACATPQERLAMRSSSTPDPFGELAARCGLRVATAEPLYAVPRDLLSPPSEAEQQVLVTLASARRPDAAPVRVLFAAPLAAGAESPVADSPVAESSVAVRDVLWWLAGDAWAVERARGDVAAWSAIHAYPPADPAAPRLYALHRRQADALRALLGEPDYDALLDAYAREIDPAAARRRLPR